MSFNCPVKCEFFDGGCCLACWVRAVKGLAHELVRIQGPQRWPAWLGILTRGCSFNENGMFQCHYCHDTLTFLLSVSEDVMFQSKG